MRPSLIRRYEWLVFAFLLIGISGLSLLHAQTPPPQAPKPAQTTPPPVLQSATQRDEPPLFPKEMVIMTIGDQKFTVDDFNQVMEVFPPQQRAFYNGPGRRKFADDFSQLIILANEARKENVAADPIVKRRMTLLADQTLAQALIERIRNDAKIPDDEIQKYYNDHLKDYEEVKASHILIRFKGSPAPLPPGKKDLTEEEAKAKADELYKEVTAPGADFAAIAKAESYDQGSASKGGDLGTFHHGQMVPAFESAAFALNPGEISQPIRTQFGYHLIRVDDKKTRTLEEVKPDIENLLRRQKVEVALENLKKAVKVDLNPQFFPAPPSSPPEAPTAPPAPKK